MMGLYENEGKKKCTNVRLTPFAYGKLDRICKLWGKTHTQFFEDIIHICFMDTLEVQSGRITFRKMLEDSVKRFNDEECHLTDYRNPIPSQPPSVHRYGKRMPMPQENPY